MGSAASNLCVQHDKGIYHRLIISTEPNRYDISSEWLTVLDAPSGEHTTMSAVISEISL